MKTKRIQKLEQQKQQNLWRSLNPKQPRRNQDFTKNDYLGRSQNHEVIECFNQATKKYGISSSAAQTIGGFTDAHAELCFELTKITNTEDACLFSSGYLANIALVSTIASKEVNLLLDKNCHSSLITGAKLAEAKLQRYQHCDLDSLKRKLANNNIIITDTIFSMSGQIAPIAQIMTTCKEHKSELIIDDAHGFGVLGENGLGAINKFQLAKNDITACTITFGKAIGTAGAAIVGASDVIESIRQFASSFLFTTALAPNFAAASCKSIKMLRQQPEHHKQLQKNIANFQKITKNLGLSHHESNTPIQFITNMNIESALKIEQELAMHGINVQAIRPPTVHMNDVGIRIVLRSDHNYHDIEQLLELLHAKINS